MKKSNSTDAGKITSLAANKGLQSTSPVMLAIDGINEMLASGRLIPGQRLAEGDLSDDLGIPRGRIREALRILAGRGLVELEPYKSARVRRLSKLEMASLFEIILGLVCAGFVLLSIRYKRLSAEEKNEFESASIKISHEAETARFDDLIRLHLSYHGLINRLCGNPHIESFMSQLHLNHFYKGVLDFVPESMTRRSLTFSVPISKAVAAGRPDTAIGLVWKSVEPIIAKLDADLLNAWDNSGLDNVVPAMPVKRRGRPPGTSQRKNKRKS